MGHWIYLGLTLADPKLPPDPAKAEEDLVEIRRFGRELAAAAPEGSLRWQVGAAIADARLVPPTRLFLLAAAMDSVPEAPTDPAHQKATDRRRRQSRARRAAGFVRAWNDRHRVGTAVVVRRDSGRDQATVTRSPAFVTESGDAVVMLRGISGYYLLERVRAEDQAVPPGGE